MLNLLPNVARSKGCSAFSTKKRIFTWQANYSCIPKRPSLKTARKGSIGTLLRGLLGVKLSVIEQSINPGAAAFEHQAVLKTLRLSYIVKAVLSIQRPAQRTFGAAQMRPPEP